MTTQDTIEADIKEMARRIVAASHPVTVILFGSQARQTSHSRSDVDLLVIAPDPVTPYQEATRLRRLLRDFSRSIDIVVVGESFAERYRDIPGSVVYPAFREGRVLYGH